MSLISILQEELVSVIADDENKQVMVELSSSGYRPRYVTLHLSKKEEVDQIINALVKAKEYLE